MGQDWILYVAVWVASASGAYLVARAKSDPDLGRWAIAGLLLGPLGVLLALVIAKPAGTAASPAKPAALVSADPMHTAAFCPQCGAKRLGNYRFCTTCKFDYDTGAPAAGAPVLATTAEPAQPESRSYVGPVLLIASIVVALLIGSQLLPGPRIVPASGSANLPPTGSIWFGSSFDTDTFEVRGRVTTAAATDTVAVVAHLTSPKDGSELNVRSYFDGVVVANTAFNADGVGDIWGWTIGPLYASGTWRIVLTDPGGNIVADGSLTVTE